MKELRQYQIEAKLNTYNLLRQGAQDAMIVHPPGTGKTVLATSVASDIVSKTDKRILFMADRKHLLHQALEEMRIAGIDAQLEANVSYAKQDAQVVIGSVQSLTSKRKGKGEMRIDRLGKFNAILVDECHHSPAPTYRKVFEACNTAKRIGFTATPNRFDGVGYDGIFSHVSHHYPLQDAIDQGWLAKPRILTTSAEIPLKGVRIVAGDFDKGDLEKKIVENIVPLAQALPRDSVGKTIVFVPTIASAEILTKTLVKFGNTAESICGDTSDAQRSAILKRFKDGDTRFLVNPLVLTEGFNMPEIETVAVCRPTYSTSTMIQMIGRALRTYPGKDFGNILQYGDAAMGIPTVDEVLLHNMFHPELLDELYKMGRKRSTYVRAIIKAFCEEIDVAIGSMAKCLRCTEDGTFYYDYIALCHLLNINPITASVPGNPKWVAYPPTNPQVWSVRSIGIAMPMWAKKGHYHQLIDRLKIHDQRWTKHLKKCIERLNHLRRLEHIEEYA